MPNYTQQKLSDARAWYENFKQALVEKGIRLNDPRSLSRVRIRTSSSQEVQQPVKGIKSVEEAEERYMKLKNTFTYAFTDEAMKEQPVHPSKDTDIFDYLNEKTRKPGELSDDHIVCLYEAALSGKLYLTEPVVESGGVKQVCYVRVLNEEVKEHDEAALLEHDINGIIRKSGKPVYVGNVCIDRDFNAYAEYDYELKSGARSRIQEKIIDEKKEEIRKQGYDPENWEELKAHNIEDPDDFVLRRDDPRVTEEVDKDLLERRCHYTDESYNALYEQHHKTDEPDQVRKDLTGLLINVVNRNKNDPVRIKSVPGIRKTYEEAITESVNDIMLFYADRYPEYFSDRKNRQTFRTIAVIAALPKELVTPDEKKKMEQYSIMSQYYVSMEKSLLKKYPGMKIKDIMKAGVITGSDGKPYSKDDTFRFMNSVIHDAVHGKGVNVRYKSKDGSIVNEFMCNNADLGLQKAFSLDEYKARFRALKKELEGTDYNLTQNSPSYEKLRTALKEAEKELFKPEKYRSCEDISTMPNQKPFRDALKSVSDACDKYLEEHSRNSKLSSRQLKRIRPMLGLKLLHDQYENRERRPALAYKDLIAEKIACAVAVRYYNTDGTPNDQRFQTYRQEGIARLTDPEMHKRNVESIKNGRALEEMLKGLSNADKDKLLQKSGKELAGRYARLSQTQPVREDNVNRLTL